MTHQEFQSKAQKNINTLLNNINNGEIVIDSTTFRYISNGKYVITVEGKRKSQYFISTSPKVTILEDKTLPVYFLMSRNGRNSKAINFTLYNGEVVILKRA